MRFGTEEEFLEIQDTIKQKILKIELSKFADAINQLIKKEIEHHRKLYDNVVFLHQINHFMIDANDFHIEKNVFSESAETIKNRINDLILHEPYELNSLHFNLEWMEMNYMTRRLLQVNVEIVESEKC